jgi:hypothetical protein
MGVTTANLIEGPATVYKGTFGATEPLDAAINLAPAASAWTDMGGTLDGVTLSINRDFKELMVDQVTDTVERRMTKRDVVLSTNLAEATLENLALLDNGSPPSTGGIFKAYDPTNTGAATQPTYVALIVDGYAPSQLRRRIIARRVLNTSSIDVAYKKDDQTVYKAEWHLHFVSTTITPYHIVDQTS